MNISRRQLMGLSALAAAASAVGAPVAVGLAWWDQAPAEGYLAFSPVEAAFLRAVAAAAWPANSRVGLEGGSAGIDLYLDRSLYGIAPLLQDAVKALLHLLDHSTLPNRFLRYSELSLAERQEVLLSWLGHENLELRSAGTLLVLLTGMGWTSHPEVAPHFAAWHGCGFGR